MSEPNTQEIKNVSSETMEETPAAGPAEKPVKEGEALSRKRRTALVAYMAVLFAVAFLLVALSMIMENKKLQSSNEKTSATLNGRIEELQNEYDDLKNQSLQQQERIAALESEAAEKDAAAQSLQQQLEEAAAAQESLEQELVKRGLALKEAEQQALDTAKVHDLLLQARIADEEGNLAEVQRLLDEIEPMKDLLTDTAKEIYESLIIA